MIAKPFLAFYSETKCLKNKMDSIKYSLEFDFGFYVDRIGLAGGLDTFWNENTTVNLFGYSSGHIDVSISLDNFPIFHFTGFLEFQKLNLDGSLGIFLGVFNLFLILLGLVQVISMKS